jgi:predicted DNA-binding transcriptional regulator AlpA
MNKQSGWMSMKEVLEDLGVARSTMDDWRARNDGPTFTKFPGGQLKIRRVDYEMWLANLQRVA